MSNSIFCLNPFEIRAGLLRKRMIAVEKVLGLNPFEIRAGLLLETVKGE